MNDVIKSVADKRERIHDNHASSRPLSKDYELLGIAGELALSEFTGFSPDLKLRPSGDDGVDNLIYIGYTVDVKVARKPFNLIHEKGKKFADIFILAQYNEEDKSATLLGWEYGVILEKAPTRDFGYGVINHYIPREKLRSLKDLSTRMIKISMGR